MPTILLLSPMGTDIHLERDRELAQSAVGPETEIVVRLVEGLPVSAYLAAEDVLLSPLLAAVRRGADDGFDAIGIICASDPGLREAKAIVRTPVTAPFEAATRIAASFGRLSVLYPGVESGPGENLPQDSNYIRRLAREYGVYDQLGPSRPVPVARPAEEVTADTGRDPHEQARITGDQVLENMTSSIRGSGPAIAEALWRDGEAEVIFAACTMWSGELDPIREAVPIPVLDPIKSLARYAEILALSVAAR